MFQRYLHPVINTTNHQGLQLPADLVITSNNKLQVTVHDVWCLANYTYLNDIIINYIFQAHHIEAARPDIYLLNSLFYTSLTHNPSLANNWTKNINIFTYNKLIILLCNVNIGFLADPPLVGSALHLLMCVCASVCQCVSPLTVD